MESLYKTLLKTDSTQVFSSAICETFIERLRRLLLYSVWISSILAMIIAILEDSMWLQPIYVLHTISFWCVECLFPIDGYIDLFSVTEFPVFITA